jgi:hypothetical protein
MNRHKKLHQLNRIFEHFRLGPMRVERFGPRWGFAVISADESVAYEITPDGEVEHVVEDLDKTTTYHEPAFTLRRETSLVISKANWTATVHALAKDLADADLHSLFFEIL